ncbi:hypothetical protein DPMN_133899 [Dreissena polymorpha]|uniref:Uncharacterized protein n=1 Tax=Dreissena polymorpha TaxID=45954 RepID=A0A9D4JDC1_DREPO|nr:hypothetical protein DPMN_133899 [Dreissena polymorpha]
MQNGLRILQSASSNITIYFVTQATSSNMTIYYVTQAMTVQQKWNSSQTLDTILAHSSKIELKPDTGHLEVKVVPNTGPVLTSLLLTKIELKPDTGHLKVKDSAEIPFKPDTGPELTSLLFGWK